MKQFAALLERLAFTPSRNEKLRLLKAYFREAPDPNRGYGLAAMAGTLDLPTVTPSAIRNLAEMRVDPVLFKLSYDYVGDLAETVSLIWPGDDHRDEIPLSTVVHELRVQSRQTVGYSLEKLLNRLGRSESLAMLKLATGGLRVGVSARLVKRALAAFGEKDVETVEEIWFGLAPPYEDLFAWLEGRGPVPAVNRDVLLRPVMLAHPLDEKELHGLAPSDFAAEWKWDGVRVQAVAMGGERRLYTRTGDLINEAFPEIIEAMTWEAVIDGELLVLNEGTVQPFDRLQKRLGRKSPSARLRTESPTHIRAYDLLALPGEDLRSLPFSERRRRLEQWVGEGRQRLDLSPLLDVDSWQHLRDLRDECRIAGYEGLMLKRLDSLYLAGRVRGHWYKWKRDPLTADCVLMYAQRGHGRRSSYYSDYTFGCWQNTDGEVSLVPVGKAYSGYSDEELVKLDKFVRDNTIDRFGPVRSVAQKLVFEVAFDAIQPSSRHKSGIAMRFPRIKRIRWDKPARDADQVETLRQMIDEMVAV